MQPQVNNHPSIEMFRQLGGRHFIAMTGAKEFMSADNPQPKLIFRVPANLTKERGTHFEISLMPNDTYTLVFFKERLSERQIIAREDGIYCDMLQDRFTAMTGLITRFGQ